MEQQTNSSTKSEWGKEIRMINWTRKQTRVGLKRPISSVLKTSTSTEFLLLFFFPMKLAGVVWTTNFVGTVVADFSGRSSDAGRWCCWTSCLSNLQERKKEKEKRGRRGRGDDKRGEIAREKWRNTGEGGGGRRGENRGERWLSPPLRSWCCWSEQPPSLLLLAAGVVGSAACVPAGKEKNNNEEDGRREARRSLVAAVSWCFL